MLQSHYAQGPGLSVKNLIFLLPLNDITPFYYITQELQAKIYPYHNYQVQALLFFNRCSWQIYQMLQKEKF